ncbi:unnamed protein product, partial [Nesidiocoris tenuis]
MDYLFYLINYIETYAINGSSTLMGSIIGRNRTRDLTPDCPLTDAGQTREDQQTPRRAQRRPEHRG